MTRDGPNAKLKLLLSPDATEAELVVPADMAEDDVNADAVVALLFEAGVTVSDAIRDRLTKVIEAWSPGVESRDVIVEGRPAKHGRNGRVEWDEAVLSEAERDKLRSCDESEAESACRATSDEPPGASGGEAGDAFGVGPTEGDGPSPGRVSFYDRCAFVMVKEGQRLGRVVAPEDGEDGEDVTGKVLSAKSGRAAKLRVDDSILIDANGELIAQQDGVLSRSLDKASVRNYLEIPGAVDFSTGNIDFDGDVKINNGVRDLFEVVATGNVDVRGLIESAVIETTGDLVSAGGMAGRERGKLRSGGDLTIRYIDSAEVCVGGNLHIERETINCETTVLGKVDSPRASVIGGRLVSVGPIEVGTLGSDAGTQTEVVVGSVPPLEERLVKLDSLVTKLEKQKERAEAEMKEFDIPGRVRTSDDAERQTELSFALMQADGQLGKCREARKSLIEKLNELRVVDLRVMKMLHAGVTVCCGVQRVTLNRDLKGPVRILRDRRGELCFRTGDGGANLPLRQVGDIHAAAA